MIRLPPAIQALVRTTPSTAPIPHRGLIAVTGSQAAQWLNGILASAVPSPPNGHFYSAFLHAQGRVLHDVFVYARPDGQGYLIEHDVRNTSEDTPPLLRVLKQFVLRAKVKIRDVSEEYDVWAAWGSDLESSWETERKWNWAERSNIAEPLWDEGVSPWGNQDLVLRDRRGVGLGHRLLVKRGERPQEASTHDVVKADDYAIHRFIRGIPEGVSEIPPMHAFPMESNLDLMGAIDFRKGCYVGQELTVRTYHTGVIRKRIFPVAIHQTGTSLSEAKSLDDGPPPSDLSIRPIVSEASDGVSARKPRGSSKLLNSVNGVGLALLRCDHVEAVDKGSVRLALGEGVDERQVSHWYPHWWPTPHSRITHAG